MNDLCIIEVVISRTGAVSGFEVRLCINPNVLDTKQPSPRGRRVRITC